MSTPAGSTIKLGTTLYSLTNEYHQRKYGFLDLIREVDKRNLGPGLEVVGFQSFHHFPNISDEAADDFKGVVDETELKLSCLSINADLNIDRDRPMTQDESVAYHEAQVRAAAKLGFPVARYQWGAMPEVIERVVPLAEKLDVKLGLEIHAPHTVDHPEVLAYREMYERVGSPYLGFIPDFGACARSIPSIYLDYYRWRGIDESMIQQALEIWASDLEPLAKRPTFLKWARDHHRDDGLAADINTIFGLFSRQPARNWLEIMHQVVHVHGKFYDVNDQGIEPAIDYDEILPVFVEGGYTGYISSEWEGHQCSDDDGFEKIARHHAMEQRIINSMAS